MTEPGDPKPEYQLSDSDFELIKLVDFRLNNLMTVLLNEPSSLTDDDLQRLPRYLFERSQAIESNQAQFTQSTNTDLPSLVASFLAVRDQLVAIAGTIGRYLKNRDLDWFNMSITDAYNNMKPQIEAVGKNPAYRAYKARISREGLEASRTHFEYETSGSGQ